MWYLELCFLELFRFILWFVGEVVLSLVSLVWYDFRKGFEVVWFCSL